MSIATFARSAIADYKSTAAVIPSSRQLARAMVAPFQGGRLRLALEFGPGTGVITRELLGLLAPGGTLLAFEINPRFVGYLRETIDDPRLQVVPVGAEAAAAELQRRGLGRADGVVSSLGIGMMDSSEANAIFQPLIPALASDAVFTQFQYVHRMRLHERRIEFFDARVLMGRHFRSVESTLVLRNVPPAHVITCRDPRRAPEAG